MFKPDEEFVNVELDYLYAAEKSYIEELSKRGLLLKIDNVFIDIPNIIERRFFCDSYYCLRKGKNRYIGSCCTDCEIQITDTDIHKLNFLFQKYRNMYKKIPKEFYGTNFIGEHYLLHKDNNTCSLSYFDKEGKLCCLVDKICHEQNLDVSDYKPHLCYIWPIVFFEYEIGKYFLTCCTPETCEIIGMGQEMGNLQCIKNPRGSWPYAYNFLEKIIIKIFGSEFFNIVKKKGDRLNKLS